MFAVRFQLVVPALAMLLSYAVFIFAVLTGHKESTQSNVRTPISHLQEAPPDVIAAMVDEADWDFDILKLEKASNHRCVSP